MNIEFYRTNKYGQALFYIKDDRIARMMQRVTGRKTISLLDIAILSEFGIKFTEVLPL